MSDRRYASGETIELVEDELPHWPGRRRPNAQVNWGKSFPGGSGLVEFVRIELPEPRDIVLYLGDPNAQMFNYPAEPNYVVSVGSGGTSFNYTAGVDSNTGSTIGVASSCRGTVLHFVAKSLYVRGDTSNVNFVPPNLLPGMRFGAQAGIGRPTTSQRMHFDSSGGNGNSALAFPLTPWSTHARLDVASFPTVANPIDTFTVKQQNTSPLGVQDVVGSLPIARYTAADGCPLHPWANRLEVTTTGGGGPPPSGPPSGAVYTIFLTETLVY